MVRLGPQGRRKGTGRALVGLRFFRTPLSAQRKVKFQEILETSMSGILSGVQKSDLVSKKTISQPFCPSLPHRPKQPLQSWGCSQEKSTCLEDQGPGFNL